MEARYLAVMGKGAKGQGTAGSSWSGQPQGYPREQRRRRRAIARPPPGLAICRSSRTDRDHGGNGGDKAR